MLDTLDVKIERGFFYPSAGVDEFDNKESEYDWFIASDYSLKDHIDYDRRTITLRGDNLHAWELLKRSGAKLSGFAAIRDGIFEGGNWEPCNSQRWWGRLEPLLNNNYIFISSYVGRLIGKSFLEGNSDWIRIDSYPFEYNFPNIHLRVWEGSKIVWRKCVKLDKVNLTYHWESIWNYGGIKILPKLDCHYKDDLCIDDFIGDTFNYDNLTKWLISNEIQEVAIPMRTGFNKERMLEQIDRSDWSGDLHVYYLDKNDIY